MAAATKSHRSRSSGKPGGGAHVGPSGARSVWKGFVRFSLVSVPCRAYTAAGCDRGAPGGESVSFHQLHKGCGARIRYVKTCPVHGEVSMSEIEKGYEFAKDQYVVVDPDELEKIRAVNERTIAVDAFLREDEVDPLYHSGRTLYLAPDGPAGRKPYAMMHRAMVEERRVAFARGVFSGRETLMLLRPVGKLITLTHLHFAEEVRAPEVIEPEIPDVEFEKKELDLAKMLIGQLTEDKFDLTQYRDHYAEQMHALVQAKVEGKEVVAPPPTEEEPQVINLMEALQRSLAEAQGKAPGRKSASSAPAGPRLAGSRHPGTARRTHADRKTHPGESAPVRRRKSA